MQGGWVLFPGLLLNCTTVILKVGMLTLRAMDSMFSESFVNPNDASCNLLFDCSIQHLLIHSACIIRCGKYVFPVHVLILLFFFQMVHDFHYTITKILRTCSKGVCQETSLWAWATGSTTVRAQQRENVTVINDTFEVSRDMAGSSSDEETHMWTAMLVMCI